MEQRSTAGDAEVVALFDASGLRPQQTSCANPRCDEQFIRSSGRGRPRYFHSDECQRSAEADLRRIQAKQTHLEQELAQTQAIVATYSRLNAPQSAPTVGSSSIDTEALLRARSAIDQMRGMSRFLARDDHEYAADLLNFLAMVEPVIDSL